MVTTQLEHESAKAARDHCQVGGPSADADVQDTGCQNQKLNKCMPVTDNPEDLSPQSNAGDRSSTNYEPTAASGLEANELLQAASLCRESRPTGVCMVASSEKAVFEPAEGDTRDTRKARSEAEKMAASLLASVDLSKRKVKVQEVERILSSWKTSPNPNRKKFGSKRCFCGSSSRY